MTNHTARCALALALATGAIASHTATAAASPGFVHIGSEYGGSLLYFTAGGGTANKVTLWASTTRVFIRDDADAINSPHCRDEPGNVVSCSLSSVSRVLVGLGDGNDSFATSGPVWLPLEVAGHDGNDTIAGGWRNDLLQGGAGNDLLFGSYGADDLQGGSGDDVLDAGPGSDPPSEIFPSQPDTGDRYSGGPGIDTADYRNRALAGVTVTLNGEADDGRSVAGDFYNSDEGDSVGADIETVIGSPQDDVLVLAPATSGTLKGEGGNDTLVGSWLGDSLYGGDGADYIPTKDGASDLVDCGDGPDVAVLDPVDVHWSCETRR